MTQADAPIFAVTGATGFLGTEILRLAEGWRVRALTRSAGPVANADEAVQCSFADVSGLTAGLHGVSTVIHAAGLAHVFGPDARNEAAFIQANAEYTVNLARAARDAKVAHFVLVSSVSVYGASVNGLVDESFPCLPESPYARSKYRAEQMAKDVLAGSATELTILRMGTIYGEKDRGNIRKLIRAIERDRFLWLGAGLNKKSLIYKADAARACLLVADRQRAANEQNTFNVCAPAITMREIVSTIAMVLGKCEPRVGIPAPLLNAGTGLWRMMGDPFGVADRIEKFMRDDAYSSKQFERTFCFSVQTELAEGMKREVQSLRNEPA
jgi:nucleoside-diphosphate-sugar epimerase